MKISLDWLADLVSWDDTPEVLASRLTAAGLNVEAIETYEQSWPGVVVARVVECGPHPDADRLSLCKVDTGDGEPTQVVCGAPNVRQGLHVLFATVGTVLPGDFKIKKAKIRGVESRGMICSASELGLGEDSDGIIELEDAPAVGTPADELFGHRDTVLDIEVTPNRPDWLSHLGVAREVAAIYGTKLTPPPVIKPPANPGHGWKVEIEDYAACPRYTAHGASGVQVGPSPRWMQNRLLAIGQRPINNVVDITNYVLMELGQPLHAFDGERLASDTITVRRAGRKLSVTTLDDEARPILADDLVIADGDGPIALAGVMGLANSEVTESTTTLLIESAFFDPGLVRRCSRRLNLVSESSYRFEREADWDMVLVAARRALYLLQEHAAAVISGDAVDRSDPDRRPRPDLPLRVHQVNRVLGTDLDLERASDYLRALSLTVQPLSPQVEAKTVNLMVGVPAFRRDLLAEVDLIEEIARVHGFEFDGRSGRQASHHAPVHTREDEVRTLLRRWLPAVGCHEIVTSTFMGRAQLDALGLAELDPRQQCLSVLNPHHGGETLLRTSMVPALVDVARRNLNAGAPAPVRLFELGRVFWPEGDKRQGKHELEHLLPEEPRLLMIGIAGVTARGLGGVPADLVELTGLVDEMAKLLRSELRCVPGDVEPYLVAGLQWEIRDARDRRVGTVGRLGQAAAEAFDLDEPLGLLELDLGRADLTPAPVTYSAFSRFPAVKRDLSLLVPAEVTYEAVSGCVRESGGNLLESLELFDHYTGKGVPDGVAAHGIRLKFRSAKGSLEGATVDRAIEQILVALSEKLGVRARTS
ncbi:phenylalanine--tRNA ligase subunit beta [bacterium]|nr:phenylalanine--tRNA ligase subunit beta [bacterium]